MIPLQGDFFMVYEMKDIAFLSSVKDIPIPEQSITIQGSVSSYGKVYFGMMFKILVDMERYLKNIVNSPSTINRLIGYYHYARNPDEPLKEYLVFAYNGKVTIIKEYDLKKETDRQIKKSFEKIGY